MSPRTRRILAKDHRRTSWMCPWASLDRTVSKPPFNASLVCRAAVTLEIRDPTKSAWNLWIADSEPGSDWMVWIASTALLGSAAIIFGDWRERG